jgi:pimeloyl-ACP methyl ester carboxylesterase
MTRRLPLMLVHGFNGVPGVWMDSGFRQYLIAQGDLDPELVRVFRYGMAPDGTYDNRGDLRQTASRLAGANLGHEEAISCSLEQLGADSVARGGPAKVTIIGHSLGGIIAKYYVSRSTPDELGTVYRGDVACIITVGTPHLGVDLLRLTRFAPADSVPWRLMRIMEALGLAPAVPSRVITDWAEAMNRLQMESRAGLLPEIQDDQARVLLSDSPIIRQIAPGSPLLAALAAPAAMPPGIACHSF